MTARIQIRRDLASNWIAPGADPVLASGEFGYETDTGVIKIGDGVEPWSNLPILFASYNSYNPTVSQGVSTNISKDGSSYHKYSRNGDTITYTVALTMTASGTSGSDVTISIPTVASSSNLIIGSGYYWYAANRIPFLVNLNTTGTVNLLRSDQVDSTESLALGQSTAIASGHKIKFTCTYEAA